MNALVPMLLFGSLLPILPPPPPPASLELVKRMTVTSDPINPLNPRALPGAEVDWTITVTNPLANLSASLNGEVIGDTVPEKMDLRVVDLAGGGSGPVEFVDGNLLGLGLTGSGLAYRFVGLGSATDGVEFSDGLSWSYIPVPDASGYDAKVRAIRIKLTGNHVAGTQFRLRFRTRIR